MSQLTLTVEQAGQRADQFLAQTVDTLTRSGAQKLLEQGVRILEFVTPQGTVRVEIVPLLAAMSSSGTFKLSVTRQGASLLVNEVMHNELLR